MNPFIVDPKVMAMMVENNMRIYMESMRCAQELALSFNPWMYWFSPLSRRYVGFAFSQTS
jgi:hypothetical protein